MSFQARERLQNDVISIAFLLFQVDITKHEKYSSIVMIGRFFRALFYTFSGSRDTTLRKKDPPGVFFSVVFSNSLNMKRRRVFPLSDSLKFYDIGFRRNDASQAYAIPVKLVKNNWGTRHKWWGKWNHNYCRVGSMSLLSMALVAFVSGWGHLISFFTCLRGFG